MPPPLPPSILRPLRAPIARGRQGSGNHRSPGRPGPFALALILVLASLAGDAVARSAEAAATAVGVVTDGEPQIRATLWLHPDHSAAARGTESGRSGRELRLGALIDLEPGWHIYWREPGESGLPTVLSWSVDGAQVIPAGWPSPQIFSEADGLLTTYGYSEQVLFEATAAVQGTELPPDAEARLAIEVLACNSVCIPATFDLRIPVAGVAAAPLAASDARRRRDLFDRFAARIPASPEERDVGLELSRPMGEPDEAGTFSTLLHVRGCAVSGNSNCGPVLPAPADSLFIPEPQDGLVLDSVQLRLGVDPDLAGAEGLTLELAGRLDGVSRSQARIQGVLAVEVPGQGTRAVRVDLPLEGEPALTFSGLARAILLALLGGLILNAMPCVMPVLAIKIFAIAEMAERSRREVLVHGFAYGLGVVLSLWGLAAVVASLRAAGASVGWGFQFQEPIFVAAVSTLLVVFALNLFGVFEIAFHGGAMANWGRDATGARRSFFEGLLAVVLATPCTAPFLGTAVGFAFTSSTAAIFAIFTAIGVGLAAPFVLISCFPAWQRWVPRSGGWMIELRRALGFALLATVVWLLWVAGRSVGLDGAIGLLALLLLVAFVVWGMGSFQAAGRTGWTSASALMALVLALAGPLVIRLEPDPASQGKEPGGPAVFDPAAVQSTLAKGQPAFVYFTADWCLTCKLNERSVLADEEVRGALARGGVAVFKADWTRRDEEIRAELARFGRAGVPLYLMYRPDAPHAPELLPELLSVRRVIEAIAVATEETSRMAQASAATEPM